MIDDDFEKGQELVERVKKIRRMKEEYEYKGCSTAYSSLDEVFPSIDPKLVTPKSLWHFSNQYTVDGYANEVDKYKLKNLLRLGLQKCVEEGHDEFKLAVNHPLDRLLQMCLAGIRKKPDSVRLTIVGDLIDNALSALENFDVIVKGNAGSHFGSGSKNCRFYITGKADNAPLFTSEYCLLDAQEIGSAFAHIYHGTVIVRGKPPNRLTGLSSKQFPSISISRFMYNQSVRESVREDKEGGTELFSATKANKYFTKIDYKKPDWIPRELDW